jgi:hypothetical protein
VFHLLNRGASCVNARVPQDATRYGVDPQDAPTIWRFEQLPLAVSEVLRVIAGVVLEHANVVKLVFQHPLFGPDGEWETVKSCPHVTSMTWD